MTELCRMRETVQGVHVVCNKPRGHATEHAYERPDGVAWVWPIKERPVRFIVWVSGPGEQRSAPWWETPLQVGADDSGEAIAKAVQWAREQGREVDRVTATRLPDEAVTPPIGVGSERHEPPF